MGGKREGLNAAVRYGRVGLELGLE